MPITAIFCEEVMLRRRMGMMGTARRIRSRAMLTDA